MENPIKMDDLGIPLFLETSKCLFFVSYFFVVKKLWFVSAEVVLFGTCSAADGKSNT